MEEVVVEQIEIQDSNFKITFRENHSGGQDLIAIISQAEFFEKLKEAYSPTPQETDCNDCRVRNIPPQDFNWFCAKYEEKQDYCPGYEAR